MDSLLEITHILRQVDEGDELAARDLLPLVYDQLRTMAAQKMALERVDHTLQATALVHDAYLRLVGSNDQQSWDSRGHFFTAAATAMRRILVEHARSRARLKRGGDRVQVEATDIANPDLGINLDQLLELDDALQKLEKSDEDVAALVRLRLYTGLSVTEAAKTLQISRTVAYERWDYALSWFSLELGED